MNNEVISNIHKTTTIPMITPISVWIVIFNDLDISDSAEPQVSEEV